MELLMKIFEKKIIIFIALTLYGIFIPLFQSYSTSSNNNSVNNINIFVYLFDKVNNINIVSSNVTLPISSGGLNLLNEFKSLNFIKDFSIEDDQISKIVLNNDILVKNNETNSWKLDVNKKRIDSLKDLSIKNNDHIEIYYSKDIKDDVDYETSSSIPSSSGPILPNVKEDDGSKLENSSSGYKSDLNKNNEFYGKKIDKELSTVVDNSIRYILNQKFSELSITSLGIYGKHLRHKDISSLVSQIQSSNIMNLDNIKLTRYIISATFSGIDATDVNGVNLIDVLYNHNGILDSNGYSNSLIAYDSNNYSVPSNIQNTREFLIENILKTQNEDGGFGLNVGEDSDIGVTVVSLIALSKYIYNNQVKNHTDRAIGYIENFVKRELFLKSDSKFNTSKIISNIITALVSLGIDIDDERFVYSGKNLLDILLNFYVEDKAFKLNKDGNIDLDSTCYSIIALSSLKSGVNPYIRTSLISTNVEDDGNYKKLISIEDFLLLIFLILAYVAVFICRYLSYKRLKIKDD